MKHGPFSGFSHDELVFVRYSTLLFLTSFFYSCTKSAEPINYGKDECEYCRMMITDNKYGAEVVTDKGKIFKFDSIECLIEFALEKNSVGDVNQSFLVTDYSKPAELIDAKTAFYVHNDNVRSPMGLNVSAFKTEQDLNSFIETNGGKKLNWVEVIELVKQSIM
jgi:copper chaperone NosL